MPHTRGPWGVMNRYAHVVAVGGGEVIADIRNGGGGYDYTAEANARLIAAAPELLAALKAVADELEGYLPDDRNSEALEDAYDAIAKAEGRV